MHNVQIIRADLDNHAHQQAIVTLIDMYSRDPMGDEQPLPDDVKQRLVPGLREHPTTIVFLAYDRNIPIGIALCFRGFSSFFAKPLINVHDLAVRPDYRGQGIGEQLLNAVIQEGKRIGGCKITLETQEHNPAQKLYKRVGFARDVHTEAAGGAIFMTRKL